VAVATWRSAAAAVRVNAIAPRTSAHAYGETEPDFAIATLSAVSERARRAGESEPALALPLGKRGAQPGRRPYSAAQPGKPAPM
jgi:hypothetical protein